MRLINKDELLQYDFCYDENGDYTEAGEIIKNMQEADCISKDQVYRLILKYVDKFEYESDMDELLAELEVAENTAKWISSNQGGFTPGGNSVKSCSNCGWVFGAHMIFPDYNYCPNCGRRIKREEIKCDQE